MTINFKFDLLNKSIICAKSALKKASDPATDEYKELMKMIALHPDYKLVERQIQKNTNKQTYKGLSVALIRTYTEIKGGNTTELDNVLEVGGYPMAKQWFLKTYKGITMTEVRKAVSEEILNRARTGKLTIVSKNTAPVAKAVSQ